jgi:acetyl-CoA carboxylase biotin carboxyl carrier protein
MRRRPRPTDLSDPKERTVTEMRAEMAANVWKIVVADGAQVATGDTLVILESMKMEIPVEAEAAGTITLAIVEGQAIDEDDLIATIH